MSFTHIIMSELGSNVTHIIMSELDSNVTARLKNIPYTCRCFL